MKIKVRFDIEEFGVFIPDGYIHSAEALRDDFLLWSYEQPDSLLATKGKIYAFSISQENFLRYLNEVVLRDSTERAYYIDVIELRSKRVKVILL